MPKPGTPLLGATASAPPAPVFLPPVFLPPAALPSPAPVAPSIPEPLLPPAPREPPIVWRFRSAAPLSGSPAVNSAGLVYVVSVEGFLYALSPDGAYRWSHGLTGMPVGGPAVDPAGNVYVATSAQRLYAFKPDGHLHWMQTVGARFASPPVWAEPGLIYYAARDRNLYSVATWGSSPQAHWLSRSANGTLASLGDGAVAVGVDAPEAQLFRRASAVARLELAEAVEQPLLGGKGHWFALTRAGLAAHDVATRAQVWAAPARRAGLSADERALVIEVDAALVWLEPSTGRELHRVQLTADTSGAAAVTNSGVALVPLMSGRLLVVEPARGHQALIALAPAPASLPAWSEASRRVTAAAGGDVLGIDLSEWVVPLRAEPDAGDGVPSDAAGGQGGSEARSPLVGETRCDPKEPRQISPDVGGEQPPSRGGA